MIVVKLPIILSPNSEPESESTIAGEQYDGNAYDSDNPSHITAEASDLEGERYQF